MIPSVDFVGGKFVGTLVEDVAGDEILGAGFRPLCHSLYPKQNLYRDYGVGLNFEHIMNGTSADKSINKFTPRLDPRSVVSHDTCSASILNRGEESTWQVDSEMRYDISSEHAIDMTFSAVLQAERFPLGYVAFMWASYMNRTRERRIHFLGEDSGVQGWTSFGDDTPEAHSDFETGTVSSAAAPDLPYEKGADTLNILEHRGKKFTKPFYYGLVDGDGDLSTTDDTMVYIMMFDHTSSVRFAMWNFICDASGNPDPHSPAWDWQYVIRNPIIGQPYGYRARMVYKPFVDRADVEKEYEDWRAQLGP
jgi:hypothetical protein